MGVKMKKIHTFMHHDSVHFEYSLSAPEFSSLFISRYVKLWNQMVARLVSIVILWGIDSPLCRKKD